MKLISVVTLFVCTVIITILDDCYHATVGLKALWRTVSVDGVSETDIEQYLKNGLCGLAEQHAYFNYFLYITIVYVTTPEYMTTCVHILPM